MLQYFFYSLSFCFFLFNPSNWRGARNILQYLLFLFRLGHYYIHFIFYYHFGELGEGLVKKITCRRTFPHFQRTFTCASFVVHELNWAINDECAAEIMCNVAFYNKNTYFISSGKVYVNFRKNTTLGFVIDQYIIIKKKSWRTFSNSLLNK